MAKPRPPEKGWKRRSARKTSVRRKQLKKCGPSCYLEPGSSKRGGARPKYPVCAKNSCRPTCGGAQAAFNRARMQRNTKVKRKALTLAKRLGCRWATDY